jgi:FKBP-type peptidyl-prolyl cis-trans isomerase
VRKPDQRRRRIRQLAQGRQAVQFVLGQRQVIAGWDQGVAGMKVGGQRRLTFRRPRLRRSRRGRRHPARCATLVFDVELLGVAKQRR